MSDLTTPNLMLNVLEPIPGKFVKDENGNWVQKKTPLLLFASVKRKSNPEFYKLPGIRTTDLFLVGEVLEKSVLGHSWVAATLPLFVTLESLDINAVLKLGDNEPESGIFRLVPIVCPRVTSFTLTLGEKINGYFRVTSRN